MVSLDEKAISSNLLFQSRNELGTVNRTVCNVTSKTENTKELWIQRFEFKSSLQFVEHHLDFVTFSGFSKKILIVVWDKHCSKSF